MTKEVFTSRFKLFEIENIANQIIEQGVNLFLFSGEMGAGKTTLIKIICDKLGVKKELVNSPSFTVINEYRAKNDKIIYHLDLFRVKEDIENYQDLGLFDILEDSNNTVLIEWPKNIIKWIDKKYCKIDISIVDKDERKIKLDIIGQ